MFPFAACFTLGAWWLQQQASLPPLGAAALVAAAFAMAAAARRSGAGAVRRAAGPLALAAWAGAGFFWAAAVAHWRLADELAPRWEGPDLRLEGTVTGLPERTETGWRFGFEADRTLAPDAHVPRRLSLGLYGRDDVPSTQPPFLPGDRLVATVRLKRPHGHYNPHGFDAEAWMLERGIRASGYVREQEPVVRSDPAGFRPSAAIDRWRLALRSRMLAVLPERPYAGVLVALALGDQEAIGPAQWQLYTRTGVNHLMSISGLHITMLAAGAALLVRAAWRRVSRLVAAVPAEDAGAWCGLAVAAAYALLSGFAIPAQRTLWMLAVVVVAGRLRIFTSFSAVLGLALFAVMAADPMAVLAPGFWLSFAAVALLALAATPAGAGASRWQAWARAQWVIFLGLAPLLVAWFDQVSLVAPLANAVAVPLVGLAVVPLALFVAIVPWAPAASAAHFLLELLHHVLAWLAALPASAYVQHAPAPWTIPLALAGAVWLLLPRGVPSRWCGVLPLLPMVLVRPPLPGPGEAWVTMLDAGQGLAVVVRTRDGVLLFDSGPAWSPEADSGGRIVVPYLRGEGIAEPGLMVVSHDDRDHTGGAASILAAHPQTTVLTSLPGHHAALHGAARVLGCMAGQAWHWSGVEFEMLHPPAGARASSGPDNAKSCVLAVRTAGASALIAADIERRSEAELVRANDGLRLRSEILVVPHHGSRTSSSPEWIAAVRPQQAWIAAGYRNRFGHPHDEVLSRYRDAGAVVYRSDRSGAVTARLSATGATTAAWRDQRRRYWHSQLP